MFETLLDLLTAALTLARELAGATPWAVPLLLALWAGLVWVSVRKGRELGGFLTLLAGVFLFFAIWNHPAFGFWQRRELNISYLYIALVVVLALFAPSLVLNLAAHLILRVQRGRGLGHSELRPAAGRPAVLSTRSAEDEEAFPVPVEEQRAGLSRAADLREGEEGEAAEEAAAGQPGTLLVADLTRSCQASNPDVAARCLGIFGDLTAEAAAAHQGRLLQSVDTALVYHFFSSRQAVACGLGLLERAARYNEDHPGAAVQVRVGVHTGLVLQSEGKVKGRDAALAAALMVTARPGGLQVSGATHDLLAASDQARFEHLGARKLKGVPEPLDIWRLAARATGSEA